MRRIDEPTSARRDRANEAGERFAAILEGAIEGAAGSSHREDVRRAADRLAREADRIADAARPAPADSSYPIMPSSKVGAAEDASPPPRGDPAAARVANAAAEAARELGDALPGLLVAFLDALDAWRRALLRSLVAALLLVALAGIALILLTIGLIVGANAVLGDPFGTLLVAVLYVVVGVGAFALARRRRRAAAREVARQLAKSRDAVARAARPLRGLAGRE